MLIRPPEGEEVRRRSEQRTRQTRMGRETVVIAVMVTMTVLPFTSHRGTGLLKVPGTWSHDVDSVPRIRVAISGKT